MRKTLIGAAGTAIVITGATAAIAVGQTTNPGPYNPTPTTTTTTTTTPTPDPLPSPGESAQDARNAIYNKLRSLAAGRALLAGRTVTVTIADAAPGSYTLTLTRGGSTGTVSGTVTKQKKKAATKIASGKKTQPGTEPATLKLKVKASKKGRKLLRRTKAKRLKVVEKITYKRSGSSSKVSKRKLTLKLR